MTDVEKYALMAVCNWVVSNGACRCMATVWAIIPAPHHRVRSLRLDSWSGTRWCVQRVPGHRSSCGDWEIGARDGGPGGDWRRHAPSGWDGYCVHQLSHNTLLFLFYFFTNKCYPSIEVAKYYHVWVEIRDKKTSSVSVSQIYVLYSCNYDNKIILTWLDLTL